MRRICITFSGAFYEETTQKIVTRAPLLGCDDVWVYDDRWLMTTDFYRQNHWLWEHHQKRGFGWYAWKPFIIWDALQHVQDKDIVLFIDADTYPIGDLSVLFQRCERDGVMLFAAEGHRHGDWCKRDCSITMGQDEDRYRDMKTGVARFMLFQKGSWRNTQFLMEWLTYVVNPTCTTFDPSRYGSEFPGFNEHRTEQAIFTNLAHKYGIYLHREACQSGNGEMRDRDSYGQLFIQKNSDVQHVTSEPSGSTFFRVPHYA